MNKSFKTLSLMISIVSAIPVAAIEPNEVKVGNVVGTIGGKIMRITDEQDAVVTLGAQEECDKKSKSLYSTLDKALVYLRGAFLIVGSVATLCLMKSRIDWTSSSDISAYCFACCMGLIVAKEAIYNLQGYRVNNYDVEKV